MNETFHTHSSNTKSVSNGHCGFMSRDEVVKFQPLPWVSEPDMPLAVERSRQRMQVAKVWSENQVLGRRYSIGCVALEITQRCNLDCTLCYLSENSESVKDIPMEEIYRRIDQIKLQFGPGTDVQITGGDPTLRKRSELMEIVRYIRDIGLRPTLMTNGIAARRDMLEELIANGLNDIAFHVDLTQERKGFTTEMQMNAIRQEYIERARNLPVAVIFNTTVYAGNFHEIPELIQFFKANADVVGMASFQLQAETGRGELRKRDEIITLDTVTEQIEKGAGTKISFETVRIGHPSCHRYGLTLQAGGKSFDIWKDQEFFNLLADRSRTLELDRTNRGRALKLVVKWLMATPEVIWPGLRFIFGTLWRMKKEVLVGKGKVQKLSFFVQNFMDASQLELDRVHACSFMVMTPRGPISMCMHNAKRDEYILQPLKVEGDKTWNPLTGKIEVQTLETQAQESTVTV